MIAGLLAKAGVSSYCWRWVSDDFAHEWAKWRGFPDMVQLLGALFPRDRVQGLLLRVALPSLELTGQLALELRDDGLLYNAAAVLHSKLPDELLCDVARAEFSLSEVAERLVAFASDS